jgi:hypothetical protein
MAEPRLSFLRGRELVNVAGESHYQDALRRITGEGEVRHQTEAHLVPEPGNPHDANAVRVEIDGHKVGYLPRTLAGAYAGGLAAIVARGRLSACEAAIVGGAETALGVFLRLPEPGDRQLTEDPARRF